jgi:Glyoxalase-like domain
VAFALRSARDALDHLILGAATLEQGVAFVRERLGVLARIGGRHPGAGTENAMVSLGGRAYLEVLAPVAGEELAPGLEDLRALTAPRLWGWAIATDDAGALAARADALGIVRTPIAEGDRRRPDGTYVRWRNLAVQLALGDAAPFFIEWSPECVHPSEDAPPAGVVRALTVHHPDPDAAGAALARLGFEVDVVRADAPGLSAELERPDGMRVKLTSWRDVA